MSSILRFWTLLFVCATISDTEARKCLRCSGAISLAECTRHSICSTSEECYMDKVFTEQHRIEFNGGCRSRSVCSPRPALLGKRATGAHVICSQCCDSDGCNARICGVSNETTTNSPVTTPASVQVCRDVNSDCSTFGRDYICTKSYLPWAKLHCAKYCGLCHAVTTSPGVTSPTTKTTSPGTTQTCRDVDPHCDTYANICAPNQRNYAQQFCARFCGLCAASATHPTAAPTTTVHHTTTKPTTSTSSVRTTTIDQLLRVFCASADAIHCPTDLDPICGSDGNFYLNKCEFSKRYCKDRSLVQRDISFCTGSG